MGSIFNMAATSSRLKTGLTTLEDECAEQGQDWEEVLQQRARETKRAKELGITLPWMNPATSVVAPIQEEPDDGSDRDPDEDPDPDKDPGDEVGERPAKEARSRAVVPRVPGQFALFTEAVGAQSLAIAGLAAAMRETKPPSVVFEAGAMQTHVDARTNIDKGAFQSDVHAPVTVAPAEVHAHIKAYPSETEESIERDASGEMVRVTRKAKD